MRTTLPADAHRPRPLLLPSPLPAEVEEFRTLYRDRFGTELPYAQAETMLTRMVQFYFLTRAYEGNPRFRRPARPLRPTTANACDHTSGNAAPAKGSPFADPR